MRAALKNLRKWGWTSALEDLFAPYADQFEVGRVAVVHRNMCRVLTIHGELEAIISRKLQTDITDITGKTQYHLSEISKFPVVGDWALLKYSVQDGKALTYGVLPRSSKISRNDPGRKTDEQVIAANIDYVLLIMALNHDFNLRRLERYLATLGNSSIKPVIILNKADLVDDIEAMRRRVIEVVADIPVHLISALKNTGVGALQPYFGAGSTCILLGSSGAGKTTLINTIIGEEKYAVQEISDYRDRGKHTTSAREMIILESGGIIIDTPGIRRIDLWEDQVRVADVFTDVVALARSCKFKNCTHTSEPDCAVAAAVAQGTLSEKRTANFRKLQAELAGAERKAKYRKYRRARMSQEKLARKTEKNEFHDREG